VRPVPFRGCGCCGSGGVAQGAVDRDGGQNVRSRQRIIAGSRHQSAKVEQIRPRRDSVICTRLLRWRGCHRAIACRQGEGRPSGNMPPRPWCFRDALRDPFQGDRSPIWALVYRTDADLRATGAGRRAVWRAAGGAGSAGRAVCVEPLRCGRRPPGRSFADLELWARRDGPAWRWGRAAR